MRVSGRGRRLSGALCLLHGSRVHARRAKTPTRAGARQTPSQARVVGSATARWPTQDCLTPAARSAAGALVLVDTILRTVQFPMVLAHAYLIRPMGMMRL